jgi:molybdopterin converting factor small subunit
MAQLRLFAQARETAGVAQVSCEGSTVSEVIQNAITMFGPAFAEVVKMSKVWVNGEEVPREHVVHNNDEVAVLPPVSGGM